MKKTYYYDNGNKKCEGKDVVKNISIVLIDQKNVLKNIIQKVFMIFHLKTDGRLKCINIHTHII